MRENDLSLEALWSTSQLGGTNAAYLEQLYEAYLRDPGSIDPRWRAYFDGLPQVDGHKAEVMHSAVRESFRRMARALPVETAAAPAAPVVELERKQVRVLQLINAYRFRGHQRANLDPLELAEPAKVPDLDLHYHGLSVADLDAVFETGSLAGPRRATLKEILDLLTRTYCGTIGAEYMHITETAEKRWIQGCLESVHGRPTYPAEVKRRLLDRLTAAEGLERYLHTKYVGQKRFSLEGAESLIPLLDELIQRSGSYGMKEAVIGMAHRGRLNVLVNIMGKTPADLFLEFEGKARSSGNGTGDVKYHLGFSSDVQTSGGQVHLALAFNPSHLEIVGPVVQGSVRARQQRLRDQYGVRVLPIVIHGDAALAGQGVVMETFNMSQLRGYSAKGTVHVIVNNQIGFTTSLQQDARSTLYASDVAKMVNAPIFHVNGDDPEAVLFVAEIALDYRMTFHKDVVIDLVSYRRHGHSEADEPAVTQPVMYHRIRELPTTRERYSTKLIAEGTIDPAGAEASVAAYPKALEAGAAVAPNVVPRERATYKHGPEWSRFLGKSCPMTLDTRLALETVRALSEVMGCVPDGFELHPQLAKVYDNRRKMAAGALPIDWGFAENLAYASLLKEGYGVRLSGQDSGRGTFFHRHAIIYNQKDGTAYVPLRNLYEGQPDFLIINSPLSEEAVLAFEYGYATAEPNTLTIWEAQFGDFANNAQVVIDQFISAGEQKWERLSGLALFLPHGYEGQGPEHSSARLERYLQLCAQQNMVVVVPTTPAQFFHVLRRQMIWDCRKPLVVFTPKSLLRLRQSFSGLEDLTQASFQPILPDSETPAEPVRRVILCAGKVYYDLVEKRRELKRDDVAILRIEQLYPFPSEALGKELRRYPNARQFVWCQEEPKNQGAWYTTQHWMRAALPVGAELVYSGRPTLAAPAVGSHDLHLKQLHELLDDAFRPLK